MIIHTSQAAFIFNQKHDSFPTTSQNSGTKIQKPPLKVVSISFAACDLCILYFCRYESTQTFMTFICMTIMHSSSMRTARGSSRPRGWSASVHAGIHPPWVWAWSPPQVWAWRHPPWPDPSTSPLGVGLETPPPETCWDTTFKACWDINPPPPPQQNDRQLQKYYLAPNFVCGRY